MNKEGRLIRKLMNYQKRIMLLTHKYDNEANNENYEPKSVQILPQLNIVDKYLMAWYSKRSLKLLDRLENERRKNNV